MPKSKFYKIATLIIVVLVLIIVATYYYLRPQKRLDNIKHIEKYSALLSQDPNNCHYLGQIASSYQALNDFDKAISFYKSALEYCPDNLLNLFQLGVSYYLIMDRDTAINYMDKAIEGAKKESDEKLTEMFVKDKTAWLKKWDLIKTMEWNEGKVKGDRS